MSRGHVHVKAASDATHTLVNHYFVSPRTERLSSIRRRRERCGGDGAGGDGGQNPGGGVQCTEGSHDAGCYSSQSRDGGAHSCSSRRMKRHDVMVKIRTEPERQGRPELLFSTWMG